MVVALLILSRRIELNIFSLSGDCGSNFLNLFWQVVLCKTKSAFQCFIYAVKLPFYVRLIRYKISTCVAVVRLDLSATRNLCVTDSTIGVFTNSPQCKNASIANFVLAIPQERN